MGEGDPLAWTAWMELLFLTGVLCLVWVARGITGIPRRVRRLSIWVLVLLIVTIISQTALIVTGLDPAKSLLARAVQDVLNMSALAVSAGTLLYIFRMADRALYGVAEIVFGAVAAGYAGWQATEGTLARLLALGASVYIIVRGLDNIATGMKAEGGTWLTRTVAEYIHRNSPEPAEGIAEKVAEDQSTDASRADRS